MNDRMTPLSFPKLMQWLLTEKKNPFGIKEVCHATTTTCTLFDTTLELPFGPAAGPHTQLSQNIITAYLAGARFFELKTVQSLDGEDLPVAKPCIYAPDECYNVEWSTELTVPQALDEYIKAWFALKLLAKEWDLGDPCGFLFNMSVGYDLEGIQSPKIDAFISSLKDASATPIWQTCTQWALAHLSLFSKVDAPYIQNISPHVSTSITLSTLHGCPPEAIERIATYLLTTKHLHTYIKCNPTLLGYDLARQLLDQHGYDYLLFDDHHFKNDLQYTDAIPMLARLMTLAKSHDLSFGVKLTNTFPVQVGAKELPGEEMYLSGKPLFLLALSVAHKLSIAFQGSLPISFSGGVDALNISDLLGTGIFPITLATTLLRPGGYSRLTQIATTLPSLTLPLPALDVAKLDALLQQTLADAYYHKPPKPLPSRKRPTSVPLLDCTFAPCTSGCPIGQDIPEYMRLCSEEKYLEALKVIVAKNPLPFMTGTICSHPCMNRCRRNFYEESVAIREVKLLAATKAMDALLKELPPFEAKTEEKVAIIGGGPAGLAAAYFLGKAGVPTTLFEKRSQLGGIVGHVVPDFRITSEAVAQDIRLVSHYGVNVHLQQPIQYLGTLKSLGFHSLIIAIGADKAGTLHLEKGETLAVLDFLERSRRKDSTLQLGKHVVIIGGGNTAMDASRAAIRTPGVESVSIVYRRTKRYMPADQEELLLALEDGVIFRELLSPLALQDGMLQCKQMVLGPADATGRRKPVPTEDSVFLPADTVITAVGDQICDAFFTTNDLPLDPSLKPIYDPHTLEMKDAIFLAGDVTTGPATVVEAIRDARRIADVILARLGLSYPSLTTRTSPSPSSLDSKKGTLQPFTRVVNEAPRCLGCDHVCSCCCDVCPNRANVALTVKGRTQILHIDQLCNACGNCTTFCPYDSSPYLEKFTLFQTKEDFLASKSEGIFIQDLSSRRFLIRLDDEIGSFTTTNFPWHQGIKELVEVLFTDYPHILA